MGEHLREVTVSEPARLRAGPKRPVDLLSTVELCEVDRLDRLATHTLGARGGGLDQPWLRVRADLKERALVI